MCTMTITAPTNPTARTLHLVDIENLIGDPYADGLAALAVLEEYLEASRWQPEDVVHIAVNPRLALEIGWRLPVRCTLRTASGPDAVDLRLQACAEPEFVARRFGRLVIGSGDHGFIANACGARSAGVGVLVVARADSLSSGWAAHGFPVVTLAVPEAATTVALVA
jgi:hypothetical protein